MESTDVNAAAEAMSVLAIRVRAIADAAAAIAFAKAIAHAALFCRVTDPIDAGVYYDAAVVAVDKGIDALADAIGALDQ